MFFYAEQEDTQSQPMGITANTVFFSNSTLNFENTCIGTTDEITINVSATGNNTETITLSDNSDQFTFSPSSFILAGGGNQSITITFSPTSWGVKTASLIASSSGGSSATASLAGVCVADPLIITSSVDTLNFGSGYVAETSSVTFVVSAGGRVQDIVLMSDDTDQFDFSPSSFSMTGSNQTQEVTVYFTPSSAGSKLGLLTLSASGGDVAHVSLTGSGIYRPLVLTPSVNSLQFDNTSTNTVSSKQFNITAVGTGSEQVTITSNSSNFYTVATEPYITIDGGQNYRIITAFAPTTTGVKTGRLTLSSSGGDIDTIDLQGTAIDQYYNNTVLLLKADTGNSGSLIDGSPLNLNVALSGNATVSSTQYKYGSSSISFDGNGDYVIVPSNADLNFGTGSFTIEMWIRPTGGLANGTQKALFGKRANNSIYKWMNAFLTYNSTTNKYALGFYVSFDSATWAIANANIDNYSINANTWTHLAFIRNGNNWHAYVNGVCYYVAYNTGTVSFDNSALGIGSNAAASPGTSGFLGYIDDIRITKGVARYGVATISELPDTAVTDPYYSNVSVLLHGNGNTYVDSGPSSIQLPATVGTSLDSLGGKFGGAIYFDGSSGYVQLGSSIGDTKFNLGSGSFTIEAWIKPNSVAASKTIYGNYGRTVTNGYRDGAHLLRLNAGKLDFYVYPTGQLLLSNTTIPTGSWTHVAVVRDGTVFKMFINGILDKTVSVASNYTLTSDPIHAPTVGAFWQTTSAIEAASWFNGGIDDFRITKGIARYTGNFTPPDSL